MIKTAKISRCGKYRYELTRIWQDTLPKLVLIGLNPSTADAETDDNTIRVCSKRAREWGYGGIVMLNLFAYRATDPADMCRAGNPVGPGNNVVLNRYRHVPAIACWGGHGSHLDRDRAVVSLWDAGRLRSGYDRHVRLENVQCSENIQKERRPCSRPGTDRPGRALSLRPDSGPGATAPKKSRGLRCLTA